MRNAARAANAASCSHCVLIKSQKKRSPALASGMSAMSIFWIGRATLGSCFPILQERTSKVFQKRDLSDARSCIRRVGRLKHAKQLRQLKLRQLKLRQVAKLDLEELAKLQDFEDVQDVEEVRKELGRKPQISSEENIWLCMALRPSQKYQAKIPQIQSIIKCCDVD